MFEKCPIQDLSKIVLATDGSEYSGGAVREAIALAKQCGSRLIVLQTIEANPEYGATAPEMLEREERAVRENIEAVKTRAEEAGVSTEIVTHEGENTWQFIVEEARNQSAEIIVMGRRGRTGLARVAMGSTTARVIGHAACDVLVVPRAAKLDCARVLVATDGSKYADAAVREAIQVASKCGGKLTAVSVARTESDLSESQKHVDKAAKLAQEAEVDLEAKVAVGKAYVEILEAAKKANAGLIVVGCHGRTGLAKLLMGSVTDRVIGYADSAVMVACG